MRQNSQVVKRKEAVPPIEWCDEEWVQKKFGVSPNQLVDLLGRSFVSYKWKRIGKL
jgi:hypothetical protein